LSGFALGPTYSAPPDPLSVFRGPILLKGGEWRGGDVEERKGEEEGRGGQRRRGEGGRVRPLPQEENRKVGAYAID